MDSNKDLNDTPSRLETLKTLLTDSDLSTQDELREKLNRLSFRVNQSTISRDLRKLGAVKTIDGSGRTVYRMGEENLPAAATSALGEMVLDIQTNGAIIVLKTTPGSASLIARQLDHTRPADILGTIAGDDTIFVAPASLAKIPATIRAIEAAL